MTSVCRKLQQISIVHQTQHTIQLLLQTSDFVGALELIASTQQMLQQELQGVKSLRLAVVVLGLYYVARVYGI